MKKIIIPRKDHEAYFIRLTENFKAKQIKAFVTEQLEKVHPSFSSSSVFDYKVFKLGKDRWIMVTVMDAETYAEYKILRRGAVFYTNTSIAAHKKDFIAGGINNIDDEQIGYDTENEKPVSIPLEEKSDNTESESFYYGELKNIPAWHGVFSKKLPGRHIFAMAASILLTICASSVFIHAAKNTGGGEPSIVVAEPAIETKYLPNAIEMLASIAGDVIKAGVTMEKWQYNEDSELLIEIQLCGIDVQKIHELCGKYEYLHLQEIQNVSYSDGKPVVAIQLKTARPEYSVINAAAFSAQSGIIAIISDLSSSFRKEEIAIVSEELPTNNNGGYYYTIAYNAKDRNLLRSLEIMGAACEKHQLAIKKMNIAINSGKNNFSVACSLSQCVVPNFFLANTITEIAGIPRAFGYRNEVPYSIPHQVKVAEAKQEAPIVGSIRDGSGQTTFHRNSGIGKISTRGINE